MLHPDIILKKSGIEGLGLFAKQNILAGTIVWTPRDSQVSFNTMDEFEIFNKKNGGDLLKYVYGLNQKIFYCTDISKHWNHSCNPNTHTLDGNMELLIQDVKKGDELTCHYGFFDDVDDNLITCNCNTFGCIGKIKHQSQHSPYMKRIEYIAEFTRKIVLQVHQPILDENETAYLQKWYHEKYSLLQIN
jgi:SET domain-containing protein